MKLKLFYVTIILFTLSVMGCKKSSNDSGPSTAAGTISAKISGTAWTAPATTTNASFDGTDLTIDAIGTSGNSINISAKITGTGTYIIDGFSGNNATYSTATPSKTYDSDFCATAGVLTITEFDITNKVMSGSFHFNAGNFSGSTIDSVLVTDGSFNKLAFLYNVSGGNTMSVTVNGTPVVANNVTATENVTAVGIQIYGSVANGPVYPKVSVVIPSGAPAGTTYQLLSTACDGYYIPSNGVSYTEKSGSLTVTAHNLSTQHIEGTFSFTAQNINGTGPIFTMTNGMFSVDY